MAWNFYTVSARPRHERNLMSPYFAANCGDCIAESKRSFWIPGSSPSFQHTRLREVVCPQSNYREQAKQRRGGAQDCLVRPLALSFDAEMGADFLERVGDILPINITAPK
jgi:hypothetical protein